MDKPKMMTIMKKVFCLPPIPTLVIAIPSFLFVAYVLVKRTVAPAISYLSYLLSAYALIITITGTVNIVRWTRQEMKQHPFVKSILSIPFVERYSSEKTFRAEVSLYPSLLINLLYAGIKLVSGILYQSVWFGTLAIYYMLLAWMRFSLLHHVRNRGRKQENRISELKVCRLCGIFLLILDWALTGIIVLVVRQNRGFAYPGMLIYCFALYTFYAVITAIVHVIKYRKYDSPVVSSIKVINLSAALVSMLSLETAMLTQFGTASEAAFRQMMSAMTGTGVSIIILGMAIAMIARTTNQISKLKEQED